MRCMVTGAAGFIGGHLADRLAGEGHQVLAVDNLVTGSMHNIYGKFFMKAGHRSVSFYDADIRDTDFLRNIMPKVEVVFHLAALSNVPRSVAQPQYTNDINVGGTLSVLTAARDAGVRRVVYSSSSSVYGSSLKLPKHEDMPPAPASPYAAQKLMGEYYCGLFSGLYGLDTISLRYFNVFGPRQNPNNQYAAVVPNFALALLQDRAATIYGDGEQSRDFTWVGDAVDANLLAADVELKKRTGESAVRRIFNIAGGNRITINNLHATMRSIIGSSKLPEHVDERPGDIEHTEADLSLAREILKYDPQTNMEDHLASTIGHFRGQM